MHDLRYAVLIEPVVIDGKIVEYSVTPPDLPGCVAAGDTPEAALSEVRGAIERWLEDARRRGLPVPEPTDKRPRVAAVTLDELARTIADACEPEKPSAWDYLGRPVDAEDDAMRGPEQRREHYRDFWRRVARAVAGKLGVRVDG